MNEQEIIQKYLDGMSSVQICKEYDTYPNKIIRILKEHGVQLRERSEAQKAALESGSSIHPTKGRKMTQETRLKQSDAQRERWDNMTESQRKEFSEGAKERWDSRSDHDKAEMRSKAAIQLRKASIEGSKAEKYLCSILNKSGYNVIPHKKRLIPGDYEIDIYIPDLMTVIELDGPQHFLPIFGEESLKKHEKYDNTKNGLLIKEGYTVIRVKYLSKRFTIRTQKQLKDRVIEALNNVSYSGKKLGKIVEVIIDE